MNLATFVRDAARRWPDAPAVYDDHGTITYAELDALADRVAGTLAELGVGPGDRVALWAEKSARVVAAMQGVLRAGAVYVPIDPKGPAMRAKRIMDDCRVAALVTTAAKAALLDTRVPAIVEGGVTSPSTRSWDDVAAAAPLAELRLSDERGLAYVLYTSGSTGTPKGVCIRHANARAFVDDMVERLQIVPEDRLSNHAPFHFDLSVFDLYAAFRAGASVTLVNETASYAPRQLVELVQRAKLTIWYSVPTALVQMMHHGGLDAARLPALRVVLFAGEVFPIKHLAALRRALPTARLLNLYGPTETNVCTIHEVGEVDESAGPIPIGHASSGDRVWAVTDDGREAKTGEVGELMVEGPTVMAGYWGEAEQAPAYATGDIVERLPDGAFRYLGRRDHMVKVRGFRIELGEIEAALATHPAIHEVAVVVVGESLDAKLVACVVPAEGQSAPRLVALKTFCAERLPPYMNVAEVSAFEAFPRTSTGKVDRNELVSLVSERRRRG